jgi:hypothetical protein
MDTRDNDAAAKAAALKTFDEAEAKAQRMEAAATAHSDAMGATLISTSIRQALTTLIRTDPKARNQMTPAEVISAASRAGAVWCHQLAETPCAPPFQAIVMHLQQRVIDRAATVLATYPFDKDNPGAAPLLASFADTRAGYVKILADRLVGKVSRMEKKFPMAPSDVINAFGDLIANLSIAFGGDQTAQTVQSAIVQVERMARDLEP